MPPATGPHQQQQLGFFQMQVEINSPKSTKAPTSNWVSFSEKGINHDLNGTLNSLNIQTAFRVEGELIETQLYHKIKGEEEGRDLISHSLDWRQVSVGKISASLLLSPTFESECGNKALLRLWPDGETINERANPRTFQSVDHFSDGSFPQQMAYGDDYPMITIYCSLLGLVILTLLIYVFYKLWQQKLSMEDAKSIEAGVFHPAFTGIKTNGGKPKSSKLTVSVKDTNDKEHLLGEFQQYSYAPQKSIPDHLLTELSQGLAVENRWKQVGTKLGFNEETLQNFEKPKISEDSGDVISAAKRMLTSWYSSRISTDSSPLTSLLVVLEGTSGTSELARRLKEYLKPSSAVTSTNSSQTSNNL
ncbi:hypothetical protein ACTXT7_006696 [Hymenolepis weldensis]